MHAQDKRAVETMCRCGLSQEAVITMFPMFAQEEVESIYKDIRSTEQMDAGQDRVNAG